MLLGFDPGKEKCGIAVMGLDRKLHVQEVVPSDRAVRRLEELLAAYPISLTIIGDRTTSKEWKLRIQERLPQTRVVTVDESNSTQEARKRYWQMYPPQGLMRLLPEGMRLPPRPVDDIVAIVLVERYLSRLVSQ